VKAGASADDGQMTIPILDHLALLELHARYAHTIDDGDAEGWAGCFTDDGVMWSTRPVEVIGRAALVEFAGLRIAGLADPERHISWNYVFERASDGNGYTGRCSASIARVTAEGVILLFSATYRDHFVQRAEGWLIARREVHYDLAGQPMI
jgi:hypothetical protein